MKNKIGNAGAILAAPYVGFMAIFVVAPILIVTFFAFTVDGGGFTLENFREMGGYLGVFARSMFLALVATVFCVLIGYPAAYFLARESGKFRSFSVLLIMLPMWINLLLRTYAWMSILERGGILNQILGFFGIPPQNLIDTQGAVVLGMVYNYLPFMILPIFTVLEKIDTSLLDAAGDLGANSRVAFRRVVFPLSLPGLLSGITMVFVPAVSTFLISQLLGGGKVMLLGDLIEMQFLGAAYNPHLGAAISLVMMGIVLISMAVMNRFGEGEGEVVGL